MNRKNEESVSGDTQTESLSIRVKGIVQGVGFRPFVYSLARRFQLSGFIFNDSDGVYIEIEGSQTSMKAFLEELRPKAPPFSRIDEIITSSIPFRDFADFTIRKSEKGSSQTVLISPDLATCRDCLAEILDRNDFRYRYPFTNCTNCGPRYTIIEGVPYDRALTSMSVFPMCPTCQKEYDDPLSRRFHAQPNACAICGPRLELKAADGTEIHSDDAIQYTVSLLKSGRIVAIKGIGGVHLACNARDENAVTALRMRKYREEKPFALMARDCDEVSHFCLINSHEKELLESEKRPVVLLSRKPDCTLPRQIAPDLDTLGFMLPYAPLHHLLLEDSGMVLVMTSGNLSDEPICFKNDETGRRLAGIADYYLMHNREIHIRCDDSVTRSYRGAEMILRRSRGYAPAPLEMPWSFKNTILACGAELKSTFCLAFDNKAILSHHIGDLENLETLDSFENGIKHMQMLFRKTPDVVACDLHPEYLSSKYALSQKGVELQAVQHHHAHLASCLADNGTDEEAIGVIFDGLGYGEDGTLWGGEFLLGDMRRYRRMASLRPLPMPGGAQAIKEPWRMALSYLLLAFEGDLSGIPITLPGRPEKHMLENLVRICQKKIASPLTSSAGRAFDAFSALIGLREKASYEGQAAILLEKAASLCDTDDAYTFSINSGASPAADSGATPAVIDISPAFREAVDDIVRRCSQSSIARKFHNTVTSLVVDMCRKIGQQSGNFRVALSGGVFQNMILLRQCHERLLQEGFVVLVHSRVPPNDGGICLGQAAVAQGRC